MVNSSIEVFNERFVPVSSSLASPHRARAIATVELNHPDRGSSAYLYDYARPDRAIRISKATGGGLVETTLGHDELPEQLRRLADS